MSRGWFADWDKEATTEYGWQPCLETGHGHIPCFEVWFASKSECEQWISENVIDVRWYPGEPTGLVEAARVIRDDAGTSNEVTSAHTFEIGEDQ